MGASAAAICYYRQIVLGDVEPALGQLAAGIDSLSTRDGRSLASDGLQAVMDVDFATPGPSGKKVREQGIARTHLPHGRRQPYPHSSFLKLCLWCLMYVAVPRVSHLAPKLKSLQRRQQNETKY